MKYHVPNNLSPNPFVCTKCGKRVYNTPTASGRGSKTTLVVGDKGYKIVVVKSKIKLCALCAG